MTKVHDYRARLRSMRDWDPFLRKESGLPGPRGNLELAKAVAEEATPRQIEAWLSIPPERAPENTPDVFLVFCGVAALGRRLAHGNSAELIRLRHFAADPRWRIREAVAIALQAYGDADMSGLMRAMRKWARGSWHEKRAAAAALAEPRLLKDERVAGQVLALLGSVTDDIRRSADTKSDSFRSLRQTMGYAWSVAIAAAPATGMPALEKRLESPSSDVRWILKENLAKKRLIALDPGWVKRCLSQLNRRAPGRGSPLAAERHG